MSDSALIKSEYLLHKIKLFVTTALSVYLLQSTLGLATSCSNQALWIYLKILFDNHFFPSTDCAPS